MPRLVRLSKGKAGPETVGVAIDPDDMDKPNTLDGSGRSWAEAGYKLAVYDDTGEPYEVPRAATRAVPREADEKK